MTVQKTLPALRRILLLLLCLALTLPQAGLAAGKNASDAEIRVLLTRLNLADEGRLRIPRERASCSCRPVSAAKPILPISPPPGACGPV